MDINYILGGLAIIGIVVAGIGGLILLRKWEKKGKEKGMSEILEAAKQYDRYCEHLLKQEEDLCLSSKSSVEEKGYDGSIIRFVAGLTQDDILVCYKIEEVKKYTKNQYGVILQNIPGSLTVLDRIPTDEILFFREMGSLQYTTSVHGGGVNVGGAIVGGLIGGDVGAIIGSRQGVVSKTEEHDGRTAMIKLTNGKEKVYDYRYYQCFTEIIPQKEYSYLIMKK